MKDLTPREIVQELDRYIIGQEEAKKVVAIALRNRQRRSKLSPELQKEVMPKNIILIGPTGVGKTEIARRLANLVDAPFVKVEATKFTEVGYVGRDVESMVRDLVNVSIRNVKEKYMAQVEDRARENAEKHIVELLKPLPKKDKKTKNPWEMMFNTGEQEEKEEVNTNAADYELIKKEQLTVKEKLEAGQLEDEIVEVEVEDNSSAPIGMLGGMSIDDTMNINDMLGNLLPKKTKKRKVPVREAREILTQQEAQELIDMDMVISEALREAQENGIIFLDEIDKIAEKGNQSGPDVSREGVQRDILPIVEGTTVNTKYGPIDTDHILFIGAGAFHTAKVSDLIPELQGRFPISVKLDNLTTDNFISILTKTENSIIKQYKALIKTEGVELVFEEDAIVEIAQIATYLNEQEENIGARRLHTVIEKLVEEISYYASDYDQDQFVISAEYVQNVFHKSDYYKDMRKYVL